MKKLNNKGFAISTLLYGLMLVAFLTVSLLMSIMSTNRKNTNTLVKKIEEELNRYSQTTTELTSTDGAQEFIVPYGKAGWYKIELWGAAARGVNEVDEVSAGENGRGAYTSGIIYLEENTHLYFQIGTKGSASGSVNNISNRYGGGATDVRLVGGNWNNYTGLSSRIMIAAGGSYSAATTQRGFGYGYGSYYSIQYPNGVYDGGSYISGFAGLTANSSYKFISTMMVSGVNAGDGKAKIELISTQSRDNPPDKKTNYLSSVRYITNCVKYTTYQEKELWREIVAIDYTGTNVAAGKTVRFANSYLLAPSGTAITGNKFTDGSLVTVNQSPKQTSSFSKVSGYYTTCIYLDLGIEHNLEEITFFHDNPTNASTDVANYSAEFIRINDAYPIRSTSYVEQTAPETYMGVKISDRNPVSSTIPTGNYYIQSALSDNRFVTVGTTAGRLYLFTGNKEQRWSITSVGTNQYKILDGVDQMALQPAEGGQEVGESISASTKYQEHAWEKWSISPISTSGYYQIKTLSGADLCLATVSEYRNKSGLLQLKTCSLSDKTQWFKFVNADY